jgi:DNA-binding CsgD family transcriptional regulator
VTARRWQVNQLSDDVAALGRRGLPREQFFAGVADRLRRVFEYDASCWHTLDPQTRLITSDAREELVSSGVYTPDTIQAASAAIVASEYFVSDVNTFAGLAARRVPVGILSQATKGRPERSARYNAVLAPSDIPFEMRAAFVSRGRVWGAVHLARRGNSADFTAEDATALATVTAAIADGLRTTLRLDAAREARAAGAPGMVILGPGDEIEMITPPARELLGAMHPRTSSEEMPPTAVLALAAFARANAGSAHHDADAVVVPTSSGWITLHASLPDGATNGRVAIVLERAVSRQATAVRLEAHGVTPREREIATLLARGLTNPEISEALVLSPYTVQDHIKNLFEKTGVASRQELVARIFLDDYMPHLAQPAPLTSNGGLA